MDLIDTRGKLSQQMLRPEGFLVMTGAGAGKVCCAYTPLNNSITGKLIIDQTLYWTTVQTEDEAIYLTGLLNSEAISLIIEDFQPRGAFGERHVHKLPFGVTPPFDPSQAAHEDVVTQTKKLISDYSEMKGNDGILQHLLNPNNGSLSSRRRRINQKIQALPSYSNYEEACKALYGI